MRLLLGEHGIEENSATVHASSLTSVLYTAYRAKLLAYIRQHIPVGSDAEDLLFAVFLVVVERENDLKNMLEHEQKAWLWSVVRNKVVDVQRRTRHYKEVPLDQAEEVLDEDLLPEQMMVQREEYQFLRVHLQHLSPRQQKILSMRFVAEMRTTEIAQMLHTSDNVVRKVLSRTLATLRMNYTRSQVEQRQMM